MHNQSHPTRIILIVMLFGAAALSSRAARAASHEQWYVLELAGQRAGYMRATTDETDETITTLAETSLTIRRGAVTINIAIDTKFIETVHGRPIRAESRQKLGTADIRQTMVFHDEHVEITNTQGAQQTQSKIPLAADSFLPPAAADREIDRQFDAGAEKATVRTLDPAVGPQVITITTTRGERTNVEVFGRTVSATEMLTVLSIMPNVVNHEYVDDAGVMLRSTMTILPGMDLHVLAADEALAKAELDPPELMASTLVAPDRPITQPRALRSARYRLRFDAHAGDPQLPDAGYQRITRADDGAVIVTVDLDSPPSPDDPPPTDAHRASSIMIGSDDPQVRKLTDRALAGLENADALERALAIRDFTRAHIDAKDLSVGFASAGEVARTGQGDCSEHAVLLAAMLRAADIPSRTVSGLVHVPSFLGRRDVFGYHMWTQAWLPTSDAPRGRWIDLDAAIGDGAFDAAHIALSHSAMDDTDRMNDLVELVPMIGTLTIEVVETGR